MRGSVMRVKCGHGSLSGALVVAFALALAPAFAPSLTGAGTAAAQVPTLNRVDSLVTAGDYEAARTSLTRWMSARDQFDVPGSDMARALMLRAQLAPDPGAAEPDYLAVVLGYPTSDHAPEALLRLGQGLLATGDAARSSAYLGRLVADYPGRPQRLMGLLWLARANSAARRPAAACTAARQGLQDARDPDLAAMLRVEAAASCSMDGRTEPAVGSADPETTTGPVTEARAGTDAGAGTGADAGADARTGTGTSAGAPAAGAPAGRPAPGVGAVAGESHDAARGDWAVQSGAFRNPDSADRLMERLRQAGYSPRIVRVPRNDLLRVRIGRFTRADEARALVTLLHGQGFDAVAVRDAAQERKP